MKNTSNDTTHGYKLILCSIFIREYDFRFNLNSNKTMWQKQPVFTPDH